VDWTGDYKAVSSMYSCLINVVFKQINTEDQLWHLAGREYLELRVWCVDMNGLDIFLFLDQLSAHSFCIFTRVSSRLEIGVCHDNKFYVQ